MKALKSQINLKVTNNTSLSQQVDILAVINNPNASNNLNTSYVYDLTGLTLTTSVQLRYYILPDTLNNIDVPFTAVPTIQGYVNALNLLGLGLFSYSGNLIYVNSNTILFSKLDF
jgi:hypothetical protein